MSAEQAHTHAELISELVDTEIMEQEQRRRDQFWSTFFIVACMSLLGVVAILGARAAGS